MRKLRLFNGSDWKCRDGRLYVAAHGVRDAVEMVNEAYRRLKGYVDRPDIRVVTKSYADVYWSADAWGRSMDGIAPTRGVWWVEDEYGSGGKKVPRRLL